MSYKAMNLTDVRKSLPALVDTVARTKQPVVITRRGEPVAQLVCYVAPPSNKSCYPLRKMAIEITDDFDDELPLLWEALG